MPFGLIFGAVVFAVLGLWFGGVSLFLPWWPLRVGGALMILFGVTVSVGLLQRQALAKRTGVVAAALLALVGLQGIVARGVVLDYVLFLAAAVAGVLLLIPATGDVRRGVPPDKPHSAGRPWMARIAAVSLAGLAVVWIAMLVVPRVGLGPNPARRSGAGPAYLEGERLTWDEYGPGLKRARADGKPVLVDFFADWCMPCKQMERVTFRDPDVVSRLEKMVTVRVDTEDTALRNGYRGVDLAERYRIEAYPTMVLMDGEGNELARHTGFLPPRALLRWVDGVLASRHSDAASSS